MNFQRGKFRLRAVAKAAMPFLAAAWFGAAALPARAGICPAGQRSALEAVQSHDGANYYPICVPYEPSLAGPAAAKAPSTPVLVSQELAAAIDQAGAFTSAMQRLADQHSAAADFFATGGTGSMAGLSAAVAGAAAANPASAAVSDGPGSGGIAALPAGAPGRGIASLAEAGSSTAVSSGYSSSGTPARKMDLSPAASAGRRARSAIPGKGRDGKKQARDGADFALLSSHEETAIQAAGLAGALTGRPRHGPRGEGSRRLAEIRRR